MKTYRLLLRDIIKRLEWRFPLLIVLTALVGIGEGISVILLLPLLKQLGIASSGRQGAAVWLLDEGLARLGASSPLQVLAVIVTIAALQALLSVCLNRWTAALARNYVGQRQTELFRAFMRAKWLFIAERKAGEMSNAIITECGRAGAAFTISLALLTGATVATVYFIFSLNISWQVTLSLTGFAATTAVLMTQLYKKTYALGSSLAPLNAEFHSTVAEHFSGAKYIKASGGEERAAARIESLVRRLDRYFVVANSLPGTTRTLLEFLAFVGLATLIVIGNKWMGVAAGDVVVVLALFGRLFPRLTAMQAQAHNLNWNVPALEVINGLQAAAEAEAERQERSDETQLLRAGVPAKLAVRNLRVELGKRRILDGVEMDFPVPDLVAVVGGSGAGKSTLAHVLLGLVEPAAGSVTLGPHDLASTPLPAWRGAIGYVPQETVLFHASVRDNLTFANPAATEAEIRLASRRAYAHQFIEALPQGFDTVIGDQGVKLSGGQRQRLSIARALLANPRVLVLDEAMSALDAASEMEIMLALEELRKEMGIILISHRIASVRMADMIYVLEEGRIAESGSWDDLMRRGARFFALAQAQGLDNRMDREAAGAR